MKKNLSCALFIAAALGAATTASAADKATQVMAANCAYCHGPNGKSRGAIPTIAGLEKGYFIQQMNDFKSGARPSVVMQKHALGYTDAEIEKLASHFSAIK